MKKQIYQNESYCERKLKYILSNNPPFSTNNDTVLNNIIETLIIF